MRSRFWRKMTARANVKARDDITQILRNAGFSGIKFHMMFKEKNRSFPVQLKSTVQKDLRDWKTKTSTLKGATPHCPVSASFIHSLSVTAANFTG